MNEHPDKNFGVLGYVQELKATIRECHGCGCLIAGNLTRCKRCSKEWDDKNAGMPIQTLETMKEVREEIESIKRALDKACVETSVETREGDARSLTLDERVRRLIAERDAGIHQLQDMIAKDEANECFLKDTASDVNALVELSNELTALGFRSVSPSSTKAAIIMLKSLHARLESLNELTRRILDEHGIPTQEDDSPETRLRRITEILHLVNLRDVQKVLEKKEGAGK